ncbi:BREX system ATP-binding domain-containing protein [Chloroflexota bacterium]
MTIGDNPKLKAILERAKHRPILPNSTNASREVALELIESCRQGTAPIRGALLLSIGRDDLIGQIREDLLYIAKGDSRLRIICGVFGIGKTFLLRVLQEFAHSDGFATSFLTLSPRECPLYDIQSVYRNVVKGIRTVDCTDKPALEDILEHWAIDIRNGQTGRNLIPNVMYDLSLGYKTVLTEYYNAINSNKPGTTTLALRWIQGETSIREAKQLGASTNLSNTNALAMLGNLTKMLRFIGSRGLVILLDEVDSITTLEREQQKADAIKNLLNLTDATRSTPNSYFVYATTPAFIGEASSDYDDSLKHISTLKQLSHTELIELGKEIRDLHFRAYSWERKDITSSSIRDFVRRHTLNSLSTPRSFVRTLVAALDICEEHDEIRFNQI